MQFDKLLAAICPNDLALRQDAAVAFSHVERVTVENMLVGLKMPLVPELSKIVPELEDEDGVVMHLDLVFRAVDGISGGREMRIQMTPGICPKGWDSTAG